MAENEGMEGAGSTEEQTVEVNAGAGNEGQPSDVNATEPASGEETDPNAATESDDDPIEEVEGPDGKKFIPKEAFDKRLAKMAAQKNAAKEEAVNGLLTELDSNPEFKQQFLERLGINPKEESGAEEAEADQASPFYQWVEQRLGQNPEYKALYTEMGQALASETQAWTQSYVKEQVQKAIAPIMRHIGETEVSSFSKQVKDFDRYKPAINKLMAEKPGLSLRDAYKLASYDDVIKGRGASVTNKNQNKLKNTPMTGKVGSNAKVGSSKTAYGSIDEALRESFKEGGWTPKPK